MQLLLDTTDLPARIAFVRAVGSAVDGLRLQLEELGVRVDGIAADTRWKSDAMVDYRRTVDRWQEDLLALMRGVDRAQRQLESVVGEMVTADLARSALPGMAVVR